jgi:transcriptional regulator with XRE-family HTH domain
MLLHMTDHAATWGAYVRRFTHSETQREIGERAGVDQATAGRWQKGEKAPARPATVAVFAQSLGRNPVEAFVAAGMLTIDQAGNAIDDDSRALLVQLLEGGNAPDDEQEEGEAITPPPDVPEPRT